MKAAFLDKIKKISVRDVPKPKIKDNELLLKVEACAICGSDIRIFNHGNPRINFPQILGHEIAGTVAEVGKDVIDFKKGDKISLSADIPCGKCEWCKNGISNNCEQTIAFGYEYQGGFAEYLKLDERILNFGPVVKVKENVSFYLLCLAEPLACCINCLEVINMKIGKSILIIGTGPIGCILALLSKINGATKVILSDINDKRLKIAEKIVKPDLIINSKESDLVSEIMKFTSSKGVDVVITACPSLKAQRDAFKVIKNKGFINFFGGLPNNAGKLNIDSNIIHYKEICVVGSHGSTPRHHKIAVDLISSGKIKLDKIISKVYSLDKINEAFEVAQIDKNNMKIIIKP